MGTVVDTDVLIVGSGPVGATFARQLLGTRPDLKVMMVDAGPRLTKRAGTHIKNILDRNQRLRAQFLSTGPAREGRVQGEVTSRVASPPGTFLLHAEGGKSGMPAAALSTNIGGMGVHWTCACPRASEAERSPLLAASEWDRLCTIAEKLLFVTEDAFPPSESGEFILQRLRNRMSDRFSQGRKIGTLPLACATGQDGEKIWTGPDRILGDLAFADENSHDLRLLSDTLCTRLLTGDGKITGATLCHLLSGKTTEVKASIYIVAADGLRTPQLLWASDIRGRALGRYLNEHPQVVAAVKIHTSQALADFPPPSSLDPHGEPVPRGAYWVPFDAIGHPFHGQIMHMFAPSIGDVIGMVWFSRKEIQAQDRLEFCEKERDGYGMPAIHVHYALTEKDRKLLAHAEGEMRNIASALGQFLHEAGPSVLPAGSSLHYMGTTRMGSLDDGNSVCDTYGQVWGVTNLFLGGNGLIASATACNPTLSSVALAVRSCERISSMFG
jgi:choline dehydrogenase-like flavoprotein